MYRLLEFVIYVSEQTFSYKIWNSSIFVSSKECIIIIDLKEKKYSL
jgi:hypothetical protein